MKWVLFLLIFLPWVGIGQVITTFVGNGTLSYLDIGDGGSATNTQIGYPIGLNFDNSGNLLVCEYDYVRRVNNFGIITTIAGSDTASGGGGIIRNGVPATTVLLGPYAVCVDKHGNFFIADQGSSEIRIVDSATSIINDYAGDGIQGYSGDGGPATNGKFNTITCVCLDTTRGFMYISDEFNYRVRKVDISSRVITTFAGTGTNGFNGDGQQATSANFSRVMGLALDHSGNLYIGDWDNGRIRKVDVSTGIVSTFAGNGTTGYSGDGGPATSAMINKSTAICFDSCGNMYFSDENNHRVRRIDAITNIMTTIAGNGIPGFSGDGGLAHAAELNHPTGICIDKAGSLYVSDYKNQRVRRITFDTLCDGSPSHVSVSSVSASSLVSIFPNPATTEITITAPDRLNTLIITNLVGQTIFNQKTNTQQVEVDVSGFPAGVYFVKINGSEVRRFVKE